MTVKLKDQTQDILMFNKVMALSDVEICKYIAEIEGLSTYVQSGSVRVMVTDGDDYYFNPLTDNNQLIFIMIKHEVERDFEHYDVIGWGYNVLDGKNPIRVTERQDFDDPVQPDLSMQKAVCLAIILNKSEDFKLS
tara:strand:+ start:30772 stop:31179 length:408 start_codon:yes stop_codon:yes gene_type:complete